MFEKSWHQPKPNVQRCSESSDDSTVVRVKNCRAEKLFSVKTRAAKSKEEGHGMLSQKNSELENAVPLQATVTTRLTDRRKCDFVEVREELRAEMLDYQRQELGDDAHEHASKSDSEQLFPKLKDLKEMFKNLKGCIPDDEAELFEFDIEQLEESVNYLISGTEKRANGYTNRLINRNHYLLDELNYRKNILWESLPRRSSSRRTTVAPCYKETSDSELSEEDSSDEAETKRRKTRSMVQSESENLSCSSGTPEEDSSDELQTKRRKTRSITQNKSKNLSCSSSTPEEDSSDGVQTKRRKTRSIMQHKSENELNDDCPLSQWKIKKIPTANILDLEDVCIVCGDDDVLTKHPLFVGGLCKEHAVLGQEKIFQYDVDGYASSCCVCFTGSTLVLCDNMNCARCYCKGCLDKYVGSGTFQSAVQSQHWNCFFCKCSSVGFLQKRPYWLEEIDKLFESTDQEFPPFPVPSPIRVGERKPIRVLSLFDGISTGLLALQQLGIEIEKFVASEINEDAIRLVKNKHPQVIHVGDITKLTDDEIFNMGPFDLLIGGSPCNDLSSVNPYRKGLIDAAGTGTLFFDYFRILKTLQPPRETGAQRPFFWLYENVVSMRKIEKLRISRFLQCEPRLADARYISAASRPRFFWGNLPGLKEGKLEPDGNDRLTVQECLEPGRKALVEKLNTVTSKFSSLYQGRQRRAPVMHDGKHDVLWATEVERVFGVPEHYTDVNNLAPSGRVALLGRSWSVPVIRQLLSPLRDYFKSSR